VSVPSSERGRQHSLAGEGVEGANSEDRRESLAFCDCTVCISNFYLTVALLDPSFDVEQLTTTVYFMFNAFLVSNTQ
jgi:hypothetical protein